MAHTKLRHPVQHFLDRVRSVHRGYCVSYQFVGQHKGYTFTLSLSKKALNSLLNSSGCSIIAACPHCSIQCNSEFGSNLLNSTATSGGVILSFLPHINATGIRILYNSFAILWRMADFAMANILITRFRSLMVWKTSSTSSLVAVFGSLKVYSTFSFTKS